jgi:DNA ligase (NAD+)
MPPMTKVSKLITLLRSASKAYYETSEPIMTDTEYDEKVEELRSLAPQHVFFSEIGATPVSGAVALPVPMPSLDKKKPETLRGADLSAASGYVLTAKLDGISALWVCGSTKKPSLYLRGDGIQGQDISHLYKGISGLKQVSAPSTMVRGELIVPKSLGLTNARNWVNGILHRGTPSMEDLAKIRFVAYQVCEPRALTRSQQMTWLLNNGFELPWTQNKRDLTVDHLKGAFEALRTRYEYECDGVVVGADAVPTLEATNPKDAYAFKMPLDDQRQRTTVLDVEWASSRTGNWIPRIRFEPVVIGAATIEYCTGFNAQFIKENMIGPGAVVDIRRSGDVIPTLEKVLVAAPTGWKEPPSGRWAWDTNCVHAVDTTEEASPEKLALEMAHQLVTLGVEGCSKTTTKKLVDAGILTLFDLKNTPAATLQKLIGAVNGQKLADQVATVLQTAKETQWILAYLGWPKGFGNTRLKAALEFEGSIAAWPTSVGTPKGISAESFAEICAAVPGYLKWLTQYRVQFDISKKVVSVPELAAKSTKGYYVLTGFRDAALQKSLADAGWVLQERITKQTTTLLVPDDGASSSKAKTASAAGIRIIPRSSAHTLF